MSFLTKGFVIALIVLAGFMSYILVHETTHLLLADEAEGICIGRCSYNSPNISPQKGISFASAFGKHNDQSMNETLPQITGLIAMTAIILGGMLCFFKEAKEWDM